MSSGKVIPFPSQPRETERQEKMEIDSALSWLESLRLDGTEPLSEPLFKDDLDLTLHLIWLRQYLDLAARGRVELNQTVFERLTSFSTGLTTYLIERLHIEALLQSLRNSADSSAEGLELFEQLEAAILQYQKPED